MTKMGLGKTVKLLRVAAGLRQSDLAERLEVSPNYVSLVENDKRDPSLSFLRSLSDELGVPLGVLFLEVESNRSGRSPEEMMLLMRIKDIALEIERLRLQRRAQISHDV